MLDQTAVFQVGNLCPIAEPTLELMANLSQGFRWGRSFDCPTSRPVQYSGMVPNCWILLDADSKKKTRR